VDIRPLRKTREIAFVRISNGSVIQASVIPPISFEPSVKFSETGGGRGGWLSL